MLNAFSSVFTRFYQDRDPNICSWGGMERHAVICFLKFGWSILGFHTFVAGKVFLMKNSVGSSVLRMLIGSLDTDLDSFLKVLPSVVVMCV